MSSPSTGSFIMARNCGGEEGGFRVTKVEGIYLLRVRRAGISQ